MSTVQLEAVRVTIPDHVVYREFPAETVVLNLESEQYYGLNPTGGAMLASLAQTGRLTTTIDEMSERYGRPSVEIEHDLRQLCGQLLERGLITVKPES